MGERRGYANPGIVNGASPDPVDQLPYQWAAKAVKFKGTAGSSAAVERLGSAVRSRNASIAEDALTTPLEI